MDELAAEESYLEVYTPTVTVMMRGHTRQPKPRRVQAYPGYGFVYVTSQEDIWDLAGVVARGPGGEPMVVTDKEIVSVREMEMGNWGHSETLSEETAPRFSPRSSVVVADGHLLAGRRGSVVSQSGMDVTVLFGESSIPVKINAFLLRAEGV